MHFANSTDLCGDRLRALFLEHTAPFRHAELRVAVRYSRRSEFSGACYYRDARLFINLGRRNRYPYTFGTCVARARHNRTHWWREVYRLTVGDAYQLALFIYLHELFHYLVKAAGRNTRRKESMCDRFAARVLVDRFGCPLVDAEGRPALREDWDISKLERFVAAAPRDTAPPRARPRVIPVIVRGLPFAEESAARTPFASQGRAD